MTDAEMRNAAICWACAGHRVFPVRLKQTRDGWMKMPAMKSPRNGGQPCPDPAPWQDAGKGGFHQGSKDPGWVSAVWAVYSGAAIGYAMPPGVVVLDIDGQECLNRLPEELRRHVIETGTFRVSTPGHSGWHVYHATDAEIGQTQCSELGVDVRVGGRGLTLLPPSSCAAGAYSTLGGSLDALEPLPRVWVDALSKARPASRTPSPGTAGRVNGARTVSLNPDDYVDGQSVLNKSPRNPKGGKWPAGTGRHPILLSRAAAMRHAGWPKDGALHVLQIMNQEIFAEPKDPELVERLVVDVWDRYESDTILDWANRRLTHKK